MRYSVPMHETHDWLSRDAAAHHAGVSVRTIDRWLSRGLLTRHVAKANHVRISRGELDGFLRPRATVSA